ncbi:MAG: hypothetical protein ACREBJ_03690, partial [Nitrosotalea sp.]
PAEVPILGLQVQFSDRVDDERRSVSHRVRLWMNNREPIMEDAFTRSGNRVPTSSQVVGGHLESTEN